MVIFMLCVCMWDEQSSAELEELCQLLLQDQSQMLGNVRMNSRPLTDFEDGGTCLGLLLVVRARLLGS